MDEEPRGTMSVPDNPQRIATNTIRFTNVRKAFVSANEIVDEVVDAIFTDRKPTADGGTSEPAFKKGDEVALMLNGLGGTPISELYLLYGRAHEQVETAGNEQTDVFGNALVRVVCLTREELHPIVGAVRKPSAKIPFGKPTPPANLQHLVQVKLVTGNKNIDGD